MTQPSVHQLFRRLETVGKGAYGSVHRGIHLPTGNIVALKIINLDTADDDVEAIQREVALLTQLRDAPNVTKYYGCFLDGPRVWIAMEFAQGGSVRTLMQSSRDGILEERFIVIITREVLVGLVYLHRSAIIHRDIKAANILITATGKVMICDFGVSVLSATTTSKRNTLMGTPNWMAPEVAQPTPVYDSKADIWSLGIMVYEMAKGAPPHSDLRDAIKVMQLIAKVKPPRLAEGDGSKDMRDFVSHCLRESPNDRLSADELSKTKWIKSASKVNVSVLRELILKYDAWIQNGGSRASLAGPLDWEDEENQELQKISEEDGDLWVFDTIRGNSLMNVPDEDEDVDLPNSIDTPSTAPTVRPAPTRLPTSLRGLFDDDTVPNDTLKPLLPPPPTTASATVAFPVVPLSSSPAREFVGMKKTGPTEGVVDVQPTKHNEISFPSYQPRYSQDITPPLPAPRLPPTSSSPIARARSTNMTDADSSPVEAFGTSLGRKPSLIRQASVAVMESTPISPLMPPVRPFAVRDRSGSSSSRGSDGSNSAKSLVLPGLKDAIKFPFLTSEHQMGMTDLLPPSPSTIFPNSHSGFLPPSPLGPHNLGIRGDANASTISLPSTRSSSPSRTDRRGKPGFTKFSHATSLSLTSVDSTTVGPPIPPLDFVSLTGSQEATNSYLARTVDDLTRWFSVIEVGFANLLEQSGGDAIAEEQEETPTEQASFNVVSNADNSAHVQPRRAVPTELL
ncbi:kinase-like domain-containing protein [Boletus reticuloceps]|uniref:non-specific serine/threonine protein kinase n=1 Tax=Boletus reticuloceps TaxID=495285 RepID=A0A8I3A6T4_9AGAM|nr:kinase-like domain-containing protein [Boletus reticuloceps]